jgi:hypothetical protein
VLSCHQLGPTITSIENLHVNNHGGSMEADGTSTDERHGLKDDSHLYVVRSLSHDVPLVLPGLPVLVMRNPRHDARLVAIWKQGLPPSHIPLIEGRTFLRSGLVHEMRSLPQDLEPRCAVSDAVDLPAMLGEYQDIEMAVG